MILLSLLLATISSTAPVKKAQLESSNPYRFIEIKSYKEEPTLPPTLMLSFELDCGDEFVQVIRQNIEDKKTGVTKIAVGGIVRENLQSSCVGLFREKLVAAGNTFSGRQYEVVKIVKNAAGTRTMKSAAR